MCRLYLFIFIVLYEYGTGQESLRSFNVFNALLSITSKKKKNKQNALVLKIQKIGKIYRNVCKFTLVNKNVCPVLSLYVLQAYFGYG